MKHACVLLVDSNQHPAQIDFSLGFDRGRDRPMRGQRPRSYRKNGCLAAAFRYRSAQCNQFSVHIATRFHLINPVERLIHVHARSLANARRHRPCRDAFPCCPTLGRQHLQVIIKLVRLKNDCAGHMGALRCPLQSPNNLPPPDGSTTQAAEFARLASPFQTHKTYAVAPLGKPTSIHPHALMLPQREIRSSNAFPTARIGRLLDAIA